MVADLMHEDMGDELAQGDVAAFAPFQEDGQAVEEDMVRARQRVGDGLMRQVHAVIEAGQLVRALHAEIGERLFVSKIGDLDHDIAAHRPEALGQGGEGGPGDGQEILPRGRAGGGEAGGGALKRGGIIRVRHDEGEVGARRAGVEDDFPSCPANER